MNDSNQAISATEGESPFAAHEREAYPSLTESPRPLVIYHANCADGFTAAWCFWHVMPHLVDFYPGAYGKPAPVLEAKRSIYLVDFSYKREQIEEWLKEGHTIFFLDHHKTAIEDLAGLEDVYSAFLNYSDVERSGAMIAWDFLNNRINAGMIRKSGDPEYAKPPLLLGYIQDRDLWKFELEQSREVAAYVFKTEYTFEKWDQLLSANAATLPTLMVAGKAILEKQQKDIKELIEANTRTMTFNGHTIPVVNCPYMWGSDLAHQLLLDYPDAPFAGYYTDQAETRKFGFRSMDDRADASATAKLYGGGGHRNACGFEVPFSQLAEKGLL